MKEEIASLQKAITLMEQAADILQKSQMAFDFSVANPHDHHVAYTRTNASGTVSQIQAKGSPTIRTAAQQRDHHYAEAKRHETEADRHTAAGRHNAAHSHSTRAEAHLNAAEALESRLPEAEPTFYDEAGSRIETSDPRHPEHTKTNLVDHAAASMAAEEASKKAWAGNGTKEDHTAAEVALRESAEQHDKVSEEHRVAGNVGLAGFHAKKANLHRDMAEEHATEAHRMWRDEQQAKQVAATNQKLTADAEGRKAAAKLRTIANRNDGNDMARKPGSWKEVHTYGKPVSSKDIEGTEARHHSMLEVFGPAPKRRKNEEGVHEIETLQDFTPEFSKKLADSNHAPFVLKHDNGKRYLVDTQGSNYARYMQPIKEEAAAPAPTARDKEITDNIMEPPDDGTLMSEKEYNRQRNLDNSELQNQHKTAIPAHRVHVDTGPHRASHLKEPKGRGGWFFSKHKDIDFGNHKEGEDYIITPSMTYTDAKKYAKEWAAKKGHSTIYVMP